MYQYAIVDSTVIRLPDREVRVVEIAFRPVDFREPRIAGSMYVDRSGGELVRLRFNFTRAAYRDASVEDITIVLENGLWDGRWWLPRRQEVEIRRGTTWLDLPARGIIRGRWEIGGYVFNEGIPDSIFRGIEIDVAPAAVRDSFTWDRPLAEAIADWAGTGSVLELREARDLVRAVAGGRDLTGMALSRPAAGGISDVVRFTRVEGLALGFGYRLRPGGGGVTVRAWGGFGFADERPKGRLAVIWRGGRAELTASARHEIADVLDGVPIAPALNSLLAQEAGRDYGDWVLLSAADVAVETRTWSGGRLRVQAGYRHTGSVAIATGSTWGTFRPNGAFGSGGGPVGSLSVFHNRGAPTGHPYARVAWGVDGGTTDLGEYVRFRADLTLTRGLGPGDLTLEGWGGWGSVDLPPDQSFALGGRASLPGESHRAFGGRSAVWGRLDWRVPVPFPAVPLGPYASTGSQVTVSPFVAVGRAQDPVAGAPWADSDGWRPVLGMSAEFFHRLLRVDVGYATRTRDVGVTLDLRQSLWPIL
jgi:hypothetical protein